VLATPKAHEVDAILQPQPSRSSETQKRFVDQRRCVEQRVASARAQPRARQPAQIFVGGREQFVRGLGIPLRRTVYQCGKAAASSIAAYIAAAPAGPWRAHKMPCCGQRLWRLARR